MNRRGEDLSFLAVTSDLSHRGVCDVAKSKGIMGNRIILLGGVELVGAREERRGAKSRRLEFSRSHSLLTAQPCNIARRRSQEESDQV